MDAVSRPRPANEPVHAYQPGSHERAVLEAKIKDLAGQRTELTMTIGGAAPDGRAAPAIEVVQPHNHRHVLGELGNATSVDVAAAIYAAKQAAPGLARAGLRRPGRDLPQGRRPAGRPVAGHAERRHHARPVQVVVPGRDRRRLRADRLLAVQRALRPAAAGRAARVGPRQSGTGWSTGRWKASCWPSRRSTSPRSPATCPPPRPCWATSWSGSRRPPSSSPRTT